MTRTIKVCVVYPVVIGVVEGLTRVLLRNWDYGTAMAWNLSAILWIAIWFPKSFLPFFRERWNRR
jgi:hypothetical protein